MQDAGDVVDPQRTSATIRGTPGAVDQPIDIPDFGCRRLAICYESMFREVFHRVRRAMALEIIDTAIEVVVDGEQLALDKIGLHRRAHADGKVGLALRKVELAVLEHQVHLQLWEIAHEFVDARQEPVCAKSMA